MAQAIEGAGLKRVDAETVREWLAADQAVLVDVREPAEFAAAHIAGSVSMPLSKFDPAQVPQADGKALVLHCQAGMRARDAAGRLLKAGHPVVWCFEGGMAQWVAAGYPVEGLNAAAAMQAKGAVTGASCRLDVQRQTQAVVGSMILTGVLLGAFVAKGWLVLCAIAGLGLLNAGLSGVCPLANGIARMPWNRA
jgi:rhodanese-related sulfurtransferase